MTGSWTCRGCRMVTNAVVVMVIITIAIPQCGCSNLRSTYLDEDEEFLLEWETTSTNITFTVTVNTTGWMGLGFSPSGGMAGSDIVIGWVTEIGIVVIQDRHATRRGTPEMDKQQDYSPVWAMKKNGKTTLKFTRKINTCDTDDREITADTMRLIYAYGASIPEGKDPPYHGTQWRGVRSVALIGLLPASSNASNSSTLDVVPSTNISVTSDSTTYWCSVIKFPEIKGKVHMIKWEPLISPGNKGVVHHMLLYGCYDQKNRSDHPQNATSFSCLISMNMPPAARECSQLIAVWAVGGGATIFPEDVGYPFDEDHHPGYVLLQTHYDNPEKKAGIVDRSGFRISVTPVLRQFDAGVIQAGHAVSGMIIPPGQGSFQLHGYCSSPCTSAGLPEGGINVFGGLVHSHLLGRQLFTRHYRNGTELKPLLKDMNYDFNYQTARSVSPPVTVLPGDTLHITCRMDSTNRTQVTFGGEATTDEMCLAYLFYYPKVNMTVCQTVPQWKYGQGTLYEELNITAPQRWKGGRYPPLETVNWSNSTNVNILQDHYNEKEEMVTECLNSFSSAIEAGNGKNWFPPTERNGSMPQPHSACGGTSTQDTKASYTSTTTEFQMNGGSTCYSFELAIPMIASLLLALVNFCCDNQLKSEC